MNSLFQFRYMFHCAISIVTIIVICKMDVIFSPLDNCRSVHLGFLLADFKKPGYIEISSEQHFSILLQINVSLPLIFSIGFFPLFIYAFDYKKQTYSSRFNVSFFKIIHCMVALYPKSFFNIPYVL